MLLRYYESDIEHKSLKRAYKCFYIVTKCDYRSSCGIYFIKAYIWIVLTEWLDHTCENIRAGIDVNKLKKYVSQGFHFKYHTQI